MAQLPARGIIDADGHVLEPADLWEDYVEERYRERGIRLRVDPAGLEYLEVDGVPMTLLSPGALGMLGAMGDDDAVMGPDRRYMEVMPLGACDPKDRVAWLDEHGLDAAAPTTAGSPTSAGTAAPGWWVPPTSAPTTSTPP